VCVCARALILTDFSFNANKFGYYIYVISIVAKYEIKKLLFFLLAKRDFVDLRKRHLLDNIDSYYGNINNILVKRIRYQQILKRKFRSHTHLFLFLFSYLCILQFLMIKELAIIGKRKK